VALLEQAIHQRGFAMIDVGNNGDIANIGTNESANKRSPQLFFPLHKQVFDRRHMSAARHTGGIAVHIVPQIPGLALGRGQCQKVHTKSYIE
jgi:hypothetical protein